MSPPQQLHFTRVTAAAAPPRRWVLFLHGILGSGSNWRSFARKLVAQQPELGACLVDLREHGDSVGMSPPHTVRRAAADLDDVVAALDGPVTAVLGHSFGGKVALAYVEARGATLERALIIDSNPGERPTARGSETTLSVLSALAAVSFPVASREAFLAEVEARGVSRGLSQWLALNLVRAEDGLRSRVSPEDIRALLSDYFALDLWPVVEHPPCALHFILGGRSSVLDDGDRARLAALEGHEPVTTELLPAAGHWVHVDAPEELLALVAAHLRR